MASLFQQVPSGQPRPPAKTSTDSNQLTSAGQTLFASAASQTVGALLGDVLVPRGAEIAFVQVKGPAGVTVELGDAGDTDRLMAAAAVTTPYMGIAAAGFPYKYTAETLIQIRVATAAAAVDGVYSYIVHYVSQ